MVHGLFFLGEETVSSRIEKAIDLLVQARSIHERLEALPDECRPSNLGEAYSIQDGLIDSLGSTVIGWKVGASNAKAQEMLQTDEPFAGRMLGETTQESPATFPEGEFFSPGVEVEVAFELAKDLPAGNSYNREQVLGAIATVYPAIEIVDSRYKAGLKAGITQIIADNGAHGAFIRGVGVTDWELIDRANSAVTLSVNSTLKTSGVSSNATGGDPLDSVIWLANDRAVRGDGLKAGDIISTGSCCAELVWPKTGDHVRAEFSGIGSVEATF